VSIGGTAGIAILGSTGSVGTTALRVLERHRDRYHVAALTAFTNGTLLAEQAARWSPGFVGLVGDSDQCGPGWSAGEGCLIEAATRADVDVVINAVVGAAGLGATMPASRRASGWPSRTRNRWSWAAVW
jgi:1-deoxy-D-xylulose-5-phosphate reductoisomerase